jgi:PST family polysaccharide transporter
MVILAPEIVKVILGPKWLETIIPFQILALGILPRVSYKIDNSLARALGFVYQRSIRDAVYAVAVVLGAWVGLHWGLAGVATGVLGAVILNDIMAIKMSLGLINGSWLEYAKTQVPGILLALIIALVAIPTRLLLLSNGSSDWFILVATTLMSGISLAGLFFWQPQKILGMYGTDALVMIFRSLPTRFFPKTVLNWFNTRIIEVSL